MKETTGTIIWGRGVGCLVEDRAELFSFSAEDKTRSLQRGKKSVGYPNVQAVQLWKRPPQKLVESFAGGVSREPG